jgi:hypothetical protein
MNDTATADNIVLHTVGTLDDKHPSVAQGRIEEEGLPKLLNFSG